MMLIIGIDPGKSGGVAWIKEGQLVPLARKMPETTADVIELIDEIRGGSTEPVMCYLELVGPRRGYNAEGVNTRSSGNEWTFAEGYGILKGIIAAMKIPLELVRPQAWQKKLSCLTGGDKNISKAKAQQLWPGEKWTHATADAALIAEYGRRLEARTEQRETLLAETSAVAE